MIKLNSKYNKGRARLELICCIRKQKCDVFAKTTSLLPAAAAATTTTTTTIYVLVVVLASQEARETT